MTDLHLYYDGVEIVNAVRFSDQGMPGFAESAATGQVAMCEVIIDDPDGSLTFETWHDFTVEEDDCAFPRLYTGVVMNARIIRGPYRDGAARQWVLTLNDVGTLLSMQIIDGTDGKRPAETDLERATWILGADYLNGEVTDTGANLTDNPINFGESDYRGQYPAEVFNSIAPTSGKTAFAYWNGSEVTVHYDENGVGIGDSTLTISNVIADQSATCFYPFIDAELGLEGEDRYSGIYYGWLGGAFLQRNTTTETDLGRRREIAYSTSRVGVLATAQTLAANTLAEHTDDRNVITCGIEVDPASVNLLRPGMRVQVKFTHLPGYETLTWTYVKQRVVGQMVMGKYRIKLDLDPLGRITGPGGGAPGGFPYQGSCDESFAEIVQSKSGQPSGVPATFALDDPPTPGNTLIVYGTNRGEPTGPEAPIGFTDAGSGIVNPAEESGAIYYRHVQVGDTVDIDWDGSDIAPDLLYVEERVGQLTFSATEFVSANPLVFGPGDFDGSPITPTSGRRGIVVGYLVLKRDEALVTAGSGWTLRENALVDSVVQHAVVELAVASTSGSYEPQFNTSTSHIAYDDLSYGAISIAFTCEGQPPSPGQEVPEQPTPTQPDGATATFPTTFPFATGSLEVWDDGINETTNIASVDAATGEFTLNYTPEAGSVLTHRFWGR